MKFEARVSEEPIEVDISEKENSFKSAIWKGSTNSFPKTEDIF